MFFKWNTCNYKNKNKLIQHLHIIAAIPNPLTQDLRGEQSTRGTSKQVDEAPETEWKHPEVTLRVHFVKRRKLKKKWLKNFE